MPGEAGKVLRALRLSQGWDKRRMALELRKVADEPLPAHLHKMIHGWETGRHEPRERYLLLYQKLFPGVLTVNGVAQHLPAADPAAILDRARNMPSPSEIIADADAAMAAGMSRETISAVKAAALEFAKQLAAFGDQLQELLGNTGDEGE